ncbi:MAG: mandelate racemase/muconate lactonizing enzyme family protein [Dehalococcoidia bacterium]|nr:mandelate racemase/muconate lactonizing enzyme family protein [Dehalococcoidia bacterium]
MKIEKVESILAGNGHYVRIQTDSGLVGIGQSSCWAYLEAVDKIVEKFGEYLVGKDPLQIEHHWQYLYRMGPFRGSALSGAISAVDIALWDIKGKHFEAPVWQLLGGKVRDRVRLHLLMGSATPPNGSNSRPDRLRYNAGLARDEGFTAIKTDPLPDGFESMTLSRLIHDTRDNVAAMREGAGLDVDIILEIHRKLTPMNAIALAETLVEFRPLFYEDPVQIDSIKSQGDVAHRTTLPVANGERMHTIWEFRELLESGGSQYIRPDLGLGGGITHVKKIAAIGESYHSALVTHNFLGPVVTAASCAIDTSIPNFLTQEYSKGDEGPENSMFTTAWRREGGYLMVPDEPGIGITVDYTALEGSAYDPRPLNVPMRVDGSVGYSV